MTSWRIPSVSWGHRRNINIGDVLKMEDMVRLIAKTVSCGGNILINVGPTKEGTIIPIFQASKYLVQILLDEPVKNSYFFCRKGSGTLASG